MQDTVTQPQRPSVGSSVRVGSDHAIVTSVDGDGMTVDVAVYPRARPPFTSHGLPHGSGASAWCWPSEA